MGVHVRNGTPVHGPSLCETCTYAHVKRGYRVSEVLAYCVATDPAHRVPFLIRDCSAYHDKTRPSFYEMEKIALTITPRDLKRTGFVPAVEPETVVSEIELKLDESE
jgi:hypothetical protein